MQPRSKDRERPTGEARSSDVENWFGWPEKVRVDRSKCEHPDARWWPEHARISIGLPRLASFASRSSLPRARIRRGGDKPEFTVPRYRYRDLSSEFQRKVFLYVLLCKLISHYEVTGTFVNISEYEKKFGFWIWNSGKNSRGRRCGRWFLCTSKILITVGISSVEGTRFERVPICAEHDKSRNYPICEVLKWGTSSTLWRYLLRSTLVIEGVPARTSVGKPSSPSF